LLLTDLYDRAAIDDRLGEDAPVGKRDGRLLDDAYERASALCAVIRTSAGSAGG
jgi:hypothetical protein